MRLTGSRPIRPIAPGNGTRQPRDRLTPSEHLVHWPSNWGGTTDGDGAIDYGQYERGDARLTLVAEQFVDDDPRDGRGIANGDRFAVDHYDAVVRFAAVDPERLRGAVPARNWRRSVRRLCPCRLRLRLRVRVAGLPPLLDDFPGGEAGVFHRLDGVFDRRDGFVFGLGDVLGRGLVVVLGLGECRLGVVGVVGHRFFSLFCLFGGSPASELPERDGGDDRPGDGEKRCLRFSHVDS